MYFLLLKMLKQRVKGKKKKLTYKIIREDCFGWFYIFNETEQRK